jgi:hypothetical protein
MAAQMTGRPFGFGRNAATVMASNPASMTPRLAELLVGLAGLYSGLGVCFAIAFLTIGISRIDPLAAGSQWSFRLLILPGTIVFWPLLLLRWAAGSIAPPVEINAHRRRAR